MIYASVLIMAAEHVNPVDPKYLCKKNRLQPTDPLKTVSILPPKGKKFIVC
jgi:hypothetical protein